MRLHLKFGGQALAGMAVLYLAFAVAQMYAGFLGIQHHLGLFAAFVALFLAFSWRFTLPLTVGAFFGAMNVWGWHWSFALLFMAPGLALLIPGVIAVLIAFLQTGKVDTVRFTQYREERSSKPGHGTVIEGEVISTEIEDDKP